jgi:hypothetical protein
MKPSIRLVEAFFLSSLLVMCFSATSWGCAFCRAKANEAMRAAAPTQSVAAAGARGGAQGGTMVRGKIGPTLLTWDDKYLAKPLQVDSPQQNPQRNPGSSEITTVDPGSVYQ